MPAILLVCSANMCRSPMASALLRRHLGQTSAAGDWHIESAGVWALEGRSAVANAQIVMAELGLDISEHRSRGVSRELLQSFDLVLTMEKGQKEALQVAFPESAGRIYLLTEMAGPAYDIADPIGGTLADFRATAHEIDHLLAAGLDRIVLLA